MVVARQRIPTTPRAAAGIIMEEEATATSSKDPIHKEEARAMAQA
jgi:hypothetical protein